ncbi:endoplasmic reticulum metallopeptidase 1-like isoform X2 [Bacillus rossius redtenbacheri]|uniref:endoplasmic reticulum metallopeptidase 1-like isoform X2 n=2 Tax=Bacillus rossius redtenbacheri TaxID=93214 RepID=UPI002FDCB220
MSNRHLKGMKGVRLRFRESSVETLPEPYGNKKQQRKSLLPLPTYYFLTALLFLTFVGGMVEVLSRRLPKPLMMDDVPGNPHRFISQRAMNHLAKLTKLGPRPAGSYENEVLAVKVILREINSIIEQAKSIHKITVDVQKTSGAFPLHFLDGMTNVYRNVQNIVVKIGSRQGSSHSLLMNCHFDTVSDSPGGSDDGASCAIMLEVLQVISRMDVPLKHNLILLFNGAEENLMQASHGFITQHRWAKEVRAFINLEACGAGGKEILFQAGPNHPWLMEVYSKSVPHPYASSLAQEIFQSGMIPGDTDFRIFRDFGNVSGLDFAWSSNGYVYHTRYDDVYQIPLGTLQRTGDNVLALVLTMTSGHHLANTHFYKEGNLIFFDFLGLVVIRWSELVGFLVNSLGVGIALFTVLRNMKQALLTNDVGRRQYAKQLGKAVGVIVAAWLLTLVAVLGLALLLPAVGCAMSWFTRPVWIVFLYAVPGLVLPMALVLLASRHQRAVISSPWTLFQLYHDGYLLIWMFLLAVSIVFRIRSGFIPLIWILFPVFGNLVRNVFFRHRKDWKWLAAYVGVLVLPSSQCLYLILAATDLYVPIMGRSGAGNHAEAVVALLSTVQFMLLFCYLVPLILLVREPQRIFLVFGSIFATALLLLFFTPLGFPYSGRLDSPTPQRFLLAHAERTYHDLSGRVRSKQTGYWVVNMDQNSPDSVMSLVPEMSRAELVQSCSTELFCGLPYLMPVVTFIWKTHWIPAAPPDIPIPTNLLLISTEYHGHNIRRMTFNVTGPDHIGVMMSPVPGATLEKWSLVDGEPLRSAKWNNRETYFVYYSCASDPEPWRFWIDLNVPDKMNYTLDIAVTSHFLHGPHQTSGEFRRFMSKFPSWTVTSGWVATYKSWKF